MTIEQTVTTYRSKSKTISEQVRELEIVCDQYRDLLGEVLASLTVNIDRGNFDKLDPSSLQTLIDLNNGWRSRMLKMDTQPPELKEVSIVKRLSNHQHANTVD